MTLIVAKKVAGNIFILADTLLTDPKKIIQEWHLVTPKILIFDNVAIAFAGVIEPVLNEWGLLPSDLTLDEAKEACLKMKGRYKNQIDFLIVRFSDVSLFQFQNNQFQVVEHAWIGNNDAFSKFQSHTLSILNPIANEVSDVKLSLVWLPSKNEDFNRVYGRSLCAFLKLLSSSTENYIGGFVVPFLVTSEVARFGSYAWMNTNIGATSELLSQTADVWHTVDFKLFSAKSGAFSIELLGSGSGFNIRIPQLMKATSWHSPFLEKVEPSGSYFGLSSPKP